MFVAEDERRSPGYAAFWNSLRRGQFQVAEYKRIGKGGREVWIQVSNPVIGEDGKPFKVVKFATDVTDRKLRDADTSGQSAAVQSATQEAVGAIGDISSTIATINEISETMAAAIEEQSAVTQEIASNMQTAASGVQAISQNMGQIVTATTSVNDATAKLRETSLALAS